MDHLECVIKDLLRKPFSTRNFTEKLVLCQRGRPTPELNHLFQKFKNCTRRFNTSSYAKYSWLAGSTELNALFCWNCLLFGQDRSTTWTKKGYVNLGSFTKAAISHEQSVGHIKSSYQLATFGRVPVDTLLDEQLKSEVRYHNEKVNQNREILRRFIPAVCFLSKQELACRGHDDSETSIKRRNYVELLKYIAEYDPLLQRHLETSKVFKVVSSTIQNDFIEAVSKSLLEEIKSEISKSPYVAVVIDEATNVCNIAQLSIVLRYSSAGQIKERFLGFLDVSRKSTVQDIYELIRAHVTEFGCNEKLVAQSYDGAATMTGKISGLQTLIKATYPHAVFIYCYAHCLNLALSNSVENIRECKIFFSTLNGIAAFFSQSSKRTAFLDEFLSQRLPPSVLPIRWNYGSRLVNTIYVHRNDLCKAFEVMLDSHDDIENEMIASVAAFLTKLSDFTFCFLLRVFDKIFSFTSVLYNTLQCNSYDIVYCRKRIEETRRNISDMKNEYEIVYTETCNQVGEPSKTVSVNFKRVYCEILDTVGAHLEMRFQDYNSINFLGLITNTERFQYHFPEREFSDLLSCYKGFFDEVRLRNEMIVFYSTYEFKGKSPFQLLQLMSEHSLSACFPQLSKLVALICTIPVSTTTVESSFSAFKRIKMYLRNKTGEKQLSNLALLSIEAALLEDIRKNSDFFERTLEFFAAEDRRIDFTYK